MVNPYYRYEFHSNPTINEDFLYFFDILKSLTPTELLITPFLVVENMTVSTILTYTNNIPSVIALAIIVFQIDEQQDFDVF